jgi:hypothetical protein
VVAWQCGSGDVVVAVGFRMGWIGGVLSEIWLFLCDWVAVTAVALTVAVAVWLWQCGSGGVAVTVWQWGCGGGFSNGVDWSSIEGDMVVFVRLGGCVAVAWQWLGGCGVLTVAVWQWLHGSGC